MEKSPANNYLCRQDQLNLNVASASKILLMPIPP